MYRILFAILPLAIIFIPGFSLNTIDENSYSQKECMAAMRIYVNPFDKPLSDFVKKKMLTMTLREKIAQMIIGSTIPENFDENSGEFKKLNKLCTDYKVGGFIFFKGSCDDYARLSNKLQELSETPLLISADFERGTGMRITDGNLFPNNMAIGASGNSELSYKMGLEISKECRLLGVQQNYAPVCDVNNNPANPIINVRSFGEDPQLVARMSAGLIKGLQEGKVISTSKHFPGHGDTDIDSHADLPVLNFDMDRLNKIELVPFKNAIEKNVMSVMIAHLSFPELEKRDHIPASLSENIVQGLLLDKLGFKGLVVTDALNMKGITKYFSTAEVAVMCVNAGIDLILMPIDELTTINAIENAVNKGDINEERIDRSVEKILKAKQWAGLFENRYVNAEDAYRLTHTEEADKLAGQIADESITLVKDDNNIIPFKGQMNNVLVVNLSDGTDNINSDYFSKSTGLNFKNVKVLNISTDKLSQEDKDEIASASGYDCVLIGIFAKIRFGTGKISILPSHIDILNTLSANNKNTAIISFGNPYLLKEFPSLPSYICAYGDSNVSIDSAIKAVLGKIKIKGKLPVSINENYPFGTGIVR